MRRFAIGAMVLTAAVVAAGVLVVVRTERALQRSRVETVDDAKIAFDLTTVSPVPTEFSQLGAASAYTAGVVCQGKMVLAGPGGLTIGTPGSGGGRQLRAGVELPAAEITGLTVGVLRGVARPVLVAATRGEGLLFLDDVSGGVVRQMRPRDAALRDVTAIAVLASGEVLIGTRNKGLLRYDGKTLAEFSAALSNVPVTTIAAKDAEFWVGTRDRGVYWWHAGELHGFGKDAGLPDEQVESIALEAGRAFVGTPLGVEEFEGGKPKRRLAEGFFAHALVVDRDRLLVGSIDQGVVAVPLDGEVRGRKALRFEATNEVRAESFVGAEGDVFAVTAEGVMRRGAGGGWNAVRGEDASVRVKPVLAAHNVSALGFGADGQLWVGYFDRGLDVVNLATGATRHTEDDHVFCVNRIAADAGRGTMDVATANGLVMFDDAGRERQVMLKRDGLIADQVTDVAFTKRGTVLATPAGLTFVDASGVSSLYGFQGLVNNHVYALASDEPSGTLMAGTLGGISILRDATVRGSLTTKNSGLKQNWITAIVAVPSSDKDAGKQRWFVGTYGRGVMELAADGQFAAMDGVTRAMEINPNAMLVTERHVFVGSLGDGLFVYDRASGRWSQVKAGLPSLNVTAMAERDGELYVGTENGVVHIAEARLAP